MTTTLADRFTEIFREEHRLVRDRLLSLAEAFRARDTARARSLLGQIAQLTGPHFRYEEESMYPALLHVYDEEYIETLFEAHDRAIGAAEALVRLAEQEHLSDEDVARAVKLVRKVLPHVSDCDGLSIMVETFLPEKIQAILDARWRSLQHGLDLLQWAREVRPRPTIAQV